jgi:hypothetical protein
MPSAGKFEGGQPEVCLNWKQYHQEEVVQLLSPDRTCKPIPCQPAATYLAEQVPLFPVVVFLLLN